MSSRKPTQPIDGEPVDQEDDGLDVGQDEEQAGEQESGDDGDDGDDEIRYVVQYHTGLRSFHDDAREPHEIRVDLRLSMLYPIDGESAYLEDDERAYAAAQRKLDPGRYRKAGNKVFMFEIGEATLDPRQIAAVFPLEDAQPEVLDDPEEPDGLETQPQDEQVSAKAASLRDRIRSQLTTGATP